MKEFATLIHRLDSTNKTTLKMDAVDQFLREAEETDKLWLLALFTGRRPRRQVSTSLLKTWVMEITGIPEWLFQECYASVGDLAETIALLLPEPASHRDRSLTAWMTEISDLSGRSDVDKKSFVLRAWNELPRQERFVFNKLLGGSFRVGLSSKGLINALAKHYDVDPNAVAHAILGEWTMESVSFDSLIRGEYAAVERSKPYPFCLAYGLEANPESLGTLSHWQVEYKWDGIRGQFIKRQGDVFIWSRGEELITAQFPELRDALAQWEGDFVLDGELLPYRNGEILNFATLQQRLNRKVVSKKLLEEVPAAVFAYDLLEWEGKDLRPLPLSERRDALEALFAHQPAPTDPLFLSQRIHVSEWQQLHELRDRARSINSEGLMLKSRNAPYHTGRKKGDWWKWKVDPLTIDAVLIYAQKGSGRRSGYYTDYTFAVRDGDTLVTIAKAYSGLTNKEIQEVSRFVSRNALEKFGPVRTVRPELVFEIAFEGISYSRRHKSGVALRFPRILRWRRDKKVDEIDRLEDVKKLIT